MLEYIAEDNDAYGYNIFRARLKDINFEDIKANILSREVDIVILRIPAKAQSSISLINNLPAEVIVADSLVEYTYKYNLNKTKDLSFNSELVYEVATPSSFEILDSLIDKAFNGYTNHYFANPYLKVGGDNNTVYKKWIRDCINGKGKVFVVKYKDEYAAFFSGRIEGNCFYGGPGGVDSKFEGHGMYLDAHKKIPQLLSLEGVSKLRTGTQIQNHVVQKQWQMLGWSLSYSWVTIHINLFISAAFKGQERSVKTSQPLTYSLVTELVQQWLPGGFAVKEFKVYLLENITSSNLTFYISEPILNYKQADHALVSLVMVDALNKIVGLAYIKGAAKL